MDGIGVTIRSVRSSITGIPPTKAYTANGGATTIRPARKTPCNGNASKDKAAVRFTQKDGKLYAFFVHWPKNEPLTVPGLGEEAVSQVALLGHDGELESKTTEGSLVVELPDTQPCQHIGALEIAL